MGAVVGAWVGDLVGVNVGALVGDCAETDDTVR